MKRIKLTAALYVFFWSSVLCGSGLAAEFHGVSELPSEHHFNFYGAAAGSGFSYHYIYHAVSKFMALSGDGSTVVSGGFDPGDSPPYLEPYRWTVNGGITWLGYSEPQQEGIPQSYATAVSYDGSIVTGRTRINLDRLWYGLLPTGYYVDEVKGFVWQNNSFTGLHWLDGVDHEALPYDISGNGALVVGDSWEGDVSLNGFFPWHRAVKWDYGITDLGTDGEADSIAYAVSGDGSVIVGVVGDVDDWWHPAVKKGGAGWQRMALLSGATCPVRCNMAVGVSVDGKKAVGHLYDGAKSAPALWDTTTATAQPFFLSQLPGKNEGGTAYDVSGLVDIPLFSGKGYIAGGNLGAQAVLWKVDQTQQSSTAERVDDLLTSLQLGSQIKGWKLSSVRQVSDDGKTLAGIGIHPTGKRWIWYADLDAPPPANDECDDAQDISVPAGYSQKKQIQGTTKNATHDVYQGCSSGKRLSVWYRFNAPADGFLALDLCGSSTLQGPALSVFGSCWGLEWGCSTGCGGVPCTEPCLLGDELVKVVAGEDYYVMVSSKDGVPGAGFTLNYQFLPINDACTEAFFLAVPSEIPGQTWLATADPAPACQGVPVTAPGVWYKVVGNGHLLTASTCDAMTDFDTQISVYCSGCSTPTCVAANNDDASCGQKSSVTWCAASGMVYDVFIHGHGGATGNFKLKIIDTGTSCTWSINCHPVHEDCQQAIPLSQGTMMVDNSGTNPLGPIASDCGGYHPIWFTYTTQCDGEVTIDTVQKTLGTLDDTMLSVYESCDGPELVCNDDYDVQFGKRSAVILSSPGGRKYRIRASSYAPYDVGTFPLRVTEVVDPVDIVPWSLPVAGEHAEYVFQLPVSGGCPFWFDGDRGLYTVGVDHLPPGMSIDSGGRLWGIPAASGSYDFTVSVGDKDIGTPGDSASYTLRVRAANDTCEAATYINEGFYLFGNQDLDTDGPEEPAICNSKSINVFSDIWFRYESLCTGMAKVDLCGSSFDTKVTVYEDDCPRGPSAVFCNDDACGDKSQLEFPVQFARPYLIRVGSALSNAQGNGQLLVTCFNDCNGNGVNDLTDIESGFSLDCNQDGHPDDCIGHEYVCDDGNPCTDDACTQGGCVFSADDANSCDDGDICNGEEKCISGICVPGIPPEPGCCVFDEDDDGDVDGRDLAAFPVHHLMIEMIGLAEEYGRNNCLRP